MLGLLLAGVMASSAAGLYKFALGAVFLVSVLGIVLLPRMLTSAFGMLCPRCRRGLISSAVRESGLCRFCGHRVWNDHSTTPES
jgi:hypothetical protein